LVRRFPFAVFFRLADDRIVVIAILHMARHPVRWQVRSPPD
jgi:plasmid stabilization system protein ParE